MPTRMVPSSARIHSWSDESRRASGAVMVPHAIRSANPHPTDEGSPDRRRTRPRSAHDLADATGVLLGQPAGVGVGLALGPDMGDGLLGVGQRERPAAVVMDLDPVDEVDLAV